MTAKSIYVVQQFYPCYLNICSWVSFNHLYFFQEVILFSKFANLIPSNCSYNCIIYKSLCCFHLIYLYLFLSFIESVLQEILWHFFCWLHILFLCFIFHLFLLLLIFYFLYFPWSYFSNLLSWICSLLIFIVAIN